MNLPPRLNKKGFTLIELLLVIALIGALAAFSTPFYARFLTQNSVAVVRDELSSHLRRAHFNAMMGKNNGSWGVTFSGSHLILFQGSSYAARDAALDETFSINPSISISGLGEIIYAKTSGLPNSTPTIIISGVGSSKTITVNSQGAVQQ